jgi:hypothetical protein
MRCIVQVNSSRDIVVESYGLPTGPFIGPEGQDPFWTTGIVTNLTRTLQSSRFLGGPIFYPVFKNGATGSTPSPFLGGFSIF